MNIALVIAGGVGSRMGANIPKQFIEVNKKPVIVHTLERIQENSEISKIAIVCIENWIPFLEKLICKYSLDKVHWVIPGGNSGHDSIRNGIFFLKDKISYDDYVMIHDAVRPVLPQKAINDVLRVAYKYGNASSSIVCHPPIVYTEDGLSGIKDIERDKIMLTASPQVYKYSLVLKYYERAEKENKHNFTFTSSMFIHYGERVFFAKGTTCNIKITTKVDLALFKALLSLSEEDLYS